LSIDLDITQDMHGTWFSKTTAKTRDQNERQQEQGVKQSRWKTIGVKVRLEELSLLNRQLDRLNYVTLVELVKDLITGKITRIGAKARHRTEVLLLHNSKYNADDGFICTVTFNETV
jgi:hypothetical protein